MFTLPSPSAAKLNAALALISLAVSGTALLSACGGGQQAVKFAPSRVIAFGDENSLIDDTPGTYAPPLAASTASSVVVTTGNGLKYTVNAIATHASDPASAIPSCETNPIWVQRMAAGFGYVFPQCNPASAATRSKMNAAYGAKVADLTTQITTFNPSNFTKTDLVTLQAGANDILAQYAIYAAAPTTTDQATLIAAVEAAGTALGSQVLRVTSTGAKVVLAKVPNMGNSPYGLAQTAEGRALLARLTERFNGLLSVTIHKLYPDGGGRDIALLAIDDWVGRDLLQPTLYGFVNVTQSACLAQIAASTPCTTETLNAALGANGLTWLWADDIHLSAGAHVQLGVQAEIRVRGNPF
jgi:outer membrane lipase/esterase